jgi:hypothetical protein
MRETCSIYLLVICLVNVSYGTTGSIVRVHKVYPDGETGSTETAAQLYQTTRRHIPGDSNFGFQLLLHSAAFTFGQHLSTGMWVQGDCKLSTRLNQSTGGKKSYIPIKMLRILLQMPVLGRIRKIARTDNLLRHVCPSDLLEQLGSHWTDCHEIWYFSISRKFVEKNQVSLKSDKNDGYFTWKPIDIFNHISLSSS